MTAVLTLEGVGVQFGSVVALRDATLRVQRGDFIALIGANGSGKTTLLQALHGLVPHSGRRVVDARGARQMMVFQRPFMLRLSVWSNLRLALWLAGVPPAERVGRADEALHRAGLSALRDRPARALSGGQQQRLALARAWATRPDVLLLDEPTANLDPSAKKEVEAMLSAFAHEGMTLVMSTHNLGQAKRLATRVVYLDQGIIRADLPTARFFQEHLDERAELFLKGDLKWDV
ncbi:MAG: ATP-binding cassette domain-containing protein [Burkholderiales bacterium]